MVEPGTHEWRLQRVGMITGSRIGGILGCTPFTSRKKVMREMVEEALGNFSDFDNVAMAWGREHEDKAAKLYELLYSGDMEVSPAPFVEEGYLGATPDRYVGDRGLVEIKCPYFIRNDTSPEFKSVHDQPHYWHQIQCQLYVTDRDWCDFFQWTPHDYHCDRVERDPKWLEEHEEEFVVFLGEYEDLLEKASSGGPEERVGLSARWAAASEAYLMAKTAMDAYKSEMDEAKKAMISLMEANNIDHCAGQTVTASKVLSKGSVDYKAMAMDQLTAEVAKPLEEQYRRKGTTSWRFKESDDE